jgi:hypothetical protein
MTLEKIVNELQTLPQREGQVIASAIGERRVCAGIDENRKAA